MPGIKKPERLTSANQPRREEVRPAQGRGRAGGGSARAGKHSLEPVGLVRSQDNLAHVDGYPKGKAKDGKGEDGKGEDAEGGGHASALGFVKQPLNRQSAVVLNSISKASNGEQDQDGDVDEVAHRSALHLGGSAEHRPVNIGAEVFAAHRLTNRDRLTLHCGAVVGRDLAFEPGLNRLVLATRRQQKAGGIDWTAKGLNRHQRGLFRGHFCVHDSWYTSFSSVAIISCVSLIGCAWNT